MSITTVEAPKNKSDMEVDETQQKIDRLAKERREQQIASRRGVNRTRQAPPPLIQTARVSDTYPDHMLNKWLKGGTAEMQGRRPTMEDTLVIDAHFRKMQNETEEEVFLAVYDGHGGREAADYIKNELHVFFRRKLEQYEAMVRLKQKLEDLYSKIDYCENAHHVKDNINFNQEEIMMSIHKMSEELTPHLSKLILQKNNRNTVKMKKILQQESVQQILQQKAKRGSDSDSEDDCSSSSSTSSTREKLEKRRKQRRKELASKESSLAPLEIYNLNDKQAIPLLLRETFLEVNESLCESRIKNGATASVVYLRTIRSLETGRPLRQCYIANVGDSRIVLCRDGKAKRLTIDHRPNDIDEQRRVRDAGGSIVNNRVNAILAITRAIGDVYLHPMVTSDPYTNTVDLIDKDSFLIVACDGVWDVVDDQDAVDHIKDEMDPRLASIKLRDLAYSRNSNDNISVVVVRWS
jgi:serine/threonine protein phosphatase PrpC